MARIIKKAPLCAMLYFGLFLESPSFAARPRSAEIGLSWMSHQMMSLTTSSTGKKDTFGTSFYHLALQYHQPVGRILWSPWMRYMPESLYSVRSPNKSSKTSLFAIGTPVTVNYRNNFDFATGPLLVRYTVNGLGSGTEVLNNGESSSEFFQPTESKTASSFAWQVGAAWTAVDYRIAADILVYGILSNKKRTISSMLTGTWIYGK